MLLVKNPQHIFYRAKMLKPLSPWRLGGSILEFHIVMQSPNDAACTWFLLKKKHRQITSFEPISNTAAVGRTHFGWCKMLSFLHAYNRNASFPQPVIYPGGFCSVGILEASVPWTVSRPIQSYAWVVFVSSGHMFFVVECLNILIWIQHGNWETLSLYLALENKEIYQNFHFCYLKKHDAFRFETGFRRKHWSRISPHFFRTIKPPSSWQLWKLKNSAGMDITSRCIPCLVHERNPPKKNSSAYLEDGIPGLVSG